MLALIDYGSGNLRSVHKALLEVGAQVRVATRGADLAHAKGIVLPGVGAFDDCLHALRQQDLLQPLRERLAAGSPFLGICVGYQALFDRSEEFNSRETGLGILPGPVVRFPAHHHLKVPHIGWNPLHFAQPNCPLFNGIPDGSYAYFVHSFFPRPADPSVVASWTDYGERFASAVWKDHLFATQFHPEKSQNVGLTLLRNFHQWAG